MNQGKHETVANYYNKFKYQAEVIAGQWGELYPPNLKLSVPALQTRKHPKRSFLL
jgi:hypothetical protein